jgi:hypothetical protein
MKKEYWTESDYCKKFCKEYIKYHPNGNIESHGWKCESIQRGIWNYWHEDGSISTQTHHGSMNFSSKYGEATHSIHWHKNGHKASEIDEKAINPRSVCAHKQWNEDGEAWLVHRNVMNNDGVILGDRYSDGSIRPKIERSRIALAPPITKVSNTQKNETPNLDEDEMPF